MYRAVVTGTASDLPIQWNYYRIADAAGHQAVFAFTLEQSLVEKFGAADMDLVTSALFVTLK